MTFLGFDLIYAEDEELYFIEANTNAQGFYTLFQVTGSKKPIEKIADFVLERVEEPRTAIIYRNICEEAKWRKKEFSKYFETHLCKLNRQQEPWKFLIDTNGLKFKPNVVLFSPLCMRQFFSKDVLVLNSFSFSFFIADKYFSSLLASKVMKIPKTFELDSEEYLPFITKLFGTYFLKPRFGSEGKCVAYMSSIKIDGEEFVIQEAIVPKQINGWKFWNIRSFVVDGEFCGAYVRFSGSDPIVNVARGAKAAKLPSFLEEDVAEKSEKLFEEFRKFSRFTEDFLQGKSPYNP